MSRTINPPPQNLITHSTMLRAPPRNGATPRRQGEEDGEFLFYLLSCTNFSPSILPHNKTLLLIHLSLSGNLDFCPVCKSSRYLNPELRFLVNPECYHKMCTSCVDRIFSSGPAPCPVAGCARTLRKQRFRKQTFDDIQIEREVDIRRRLAQM